MKLYNSKGEIEEFDGYEYLDHGRCAYIYRKGDKVIKLYNLDNRYPFFLGKKMFKKLKEIDDPNIVRLLDYYFQYDGFYTTITPMDAYTMDYVKDDDITVIDEPTDYLFTMVNRLDETIDNLTENKILIRDPHYRNIIFNKENVTLVDPDTYEFHRLMPYKKLRLQNQKAMLDFISSKLMHEFKQGDADYWLVCKDIERIKPQEDKSLKELLEPIINDTTPRKSMYKRKRLFY